MHIHCLGLNHTTAPVSLREKFSFSEETISLFFNDPQRDVVAEDAGETVLLSTCNRVEVYSVSAQLDFSLPEALLCEASGLAPDDVRPHLYRYSDAEAVRHLFEVAAGLDSPVLGEPQILGQVAHALELARRRGACGPLLNRLFQTAVHAGKRVRAETAIGRNPASISSLSAALCERLVHPLSAAQVVILGAGEMAELAVEALRKRGVEKILVVNRSLENARALVQRWGGEPATFDELDDALVRADILIASTGAPHTLIQAERVAAAMARRPARPLVLIDIAVPRDIAPEVGGLPGVRLFDIDGLNADLEESLAQRAQEVPQVRSILLEEQREFLQFLKTLDMLPIIADLRQRAESVRQAELKRTLRHLPNLSDTERARIDAMTQALVKKLLEAPTHRLRAEAACPHAPEYAMVARTLFGLEDGPGLCSFSGQDCPAATASD